MSTLDEELARAIAEGEAEEAKAGGANGDAGAASDQTSAAQDDGPGGVSKPVSQPRAAPARRNIGLLISLFAIAAVILGLVFTGSDEPGMIYSMDVDQAVQKRDSLADRSVRVQGILVSGTLVKRDSPCEYRFKVAKNGQQLEVHYPQCVVPDTFRDVKDVEVEVTAEGRFTSAGHLQADSIFAKCPSKYEMQQQANAGIQAPHADKPVTIDPTQIQ